MDTVDNVLLSYIYDTFPKGKVFFAEDLEVTGYSHDVIRWSLVRLVKMETGVVRLSRGVYCYPKLYPGTGKLLLPSTGVVAQALASRWKVRIAPCGEQAAYLAGFTGLQLGMDTYVSDGSDQVFHLQDGKKIVFTKRKSLKVFRFRSEVMRNLVEAMRYLGKEYCAEPEAKGIVAGNLLKVSDGDFVYDCRLCPSWIREYLRQMR